MSALQPLSKPRPYHPPTLKVLGTFAQLTQERATAGLHDPHRPLHTS